MSPVFHGSWGGGAVTWDAREASRPMSLQGKLGFSRQKQSRHPRRMFSQNLRVLVGKEHVTFSFRAKPLFSCFQVVLATVYAFGTKFKVSNVEP